MSPRDVIESRGVAEVIRRPASAILAVLAGLVLGVGAKATLAATGSPPQTGPVAAAVAEEAPRSDQRLGSAADANAEREKNRPADQNNGLPTTAASVTEPTGITGAMDAVDDYATRLNDGTRAGAAVVPFDYGSGPLAAGTTTAGPAWSVMKVPAAAAYLRFRQETNGAPSGQATLPDGSSEREDLGLALVQSDNLAIRRPIQEMIEADGPDLTAAGIDEVLQAGGVDATISPTLDPSIDSLEIGTSDWNLDQAAEWFRRLQVNAECLGLAEEDRVFLLRQLAAAPSALPWGAADALPTDSIALKPGWGAGADGYTVEQLVIVGHGDEADGFPSFRGGYVMALMATVPGSDQASFVAGQQHLAEMAALIDEQMGVPDQGVSEDLAATC